MKFAIGSQLSLLLLALAQCGVSTQADSSIPHPCDTIQCPPAADMVCPPDSSVRELIPEPLIAEDELWTNGSMPDVSSKEFAQCCLSQKCLCKTCYIPDCHNDNEVVVALQPESMDTPGHCCGKYECQTEPNCSDSNTLDTVWLTNCQRCLCLAGEKICHQICEDGNKRPAAFCHSKALNQFFKHGDTWRDGCYECECVNGEPNCLINFCRAVNCPAHRQVMLKDSCCPVCWPKGHRMPNTDVEYDEDVEGGESGHHQYDDEGGHDYNEHDDNIEPNFELKPIEEPFKNLTLPANESGEASAANATAVANLNSSTTPSASSSSSSSTSTTLTTPTTTTTTTTTEAPATKPSLATTPAAAEQPTPLPTQPPTTSQPCKQTISDAIGHDGQPPTAAPCATASYQAYPKVVEVMRSSQHNVLLYTIIGCLSIIVIGLVAWNIHLKAKQRSYRPVSNLDDNFNTMPSNIKKTNDFV